MAADDAFYVVPRTRESPLSRGVDVTPSDTAELEFLPRAVLVTVAGNLEVIWPTGTTQVVPVSANLLYPWSVKAIKAANTTATGIKIFD
jgi:hypothetical protein